MALITPTSRHRNLALFNTPVELHLQSHLIACHLVIAHCHFTLVLQLPIQVQFRFFSQQQLQKELLSTLRRVHLEVRFGAFRLKEVVLAMKDILPQVLDGVHLFFLVVHHYLVRGLLFDSSPIRHPIPYLELILVHHSEL